MDRITLIIVDCQYDFISGSLAVSKARDAVDNICKFIKLNAEKISNIICTVDWHPINHCSFIDNGGIWPVHCVKCTVGAGVDFTLLETLKDAKLKYNVYAKGTNPEVEEYGAFTEYTIEDGTFNSHLCSVDLSTDIVVCGIAGDYCVQKTLDNLLEVNPKVFLKGVASIDGGTSISSYIKNHNLEIVE